MAETPHNALYEEQANQFLQQSQHANASASAASSTSAPAGPSTVSYAPPIPPPALVQLPQQQQQQQQAVAPPFVLPFAINLKDLLTLVTADHNLYATLTRTCKITYVSKDREAEMLD